MVCGFVCTVFPAAATTSCARAAASLVAPQPMLGWGIAQRIQQISQDVLQVGQGSLYPALHRLEQRGWIGSEWSTSDNNRRAKFYSLTRAGMNQLEKELGEWERLSAAIALVLEQS